MSTIDSLRITVWVPDPTGTAYMFQAPDFGHNETTDLRQVFMETGGGSQIVLDRGPRIYRLELSFSWLTRSDRDLMQNLFDGVLTGGRDTFTLDIPKYETILSEGGKLDPVGFYRYNVASFDGQGSISFVEQRDGFYSTSWAIRADERVQNP